MEEIKKLLIKQMLTKHPEEQVLNQLLLGIRLYVPQTSGCELKVDKSNVTVNLIPFKGLKGFWNKITNKNKLTSFQQQNVENLVKFWLSYIRDVVIQINWIIPT